MTNKYDIEKPKALSASALKDILKGKSHKISKTEALRLLMRKKDNDKHLLFARLLRNKNESSILRYDAAIALANSMHSRKSEILIEELRITDTPDIVDGLLYSLAFSGKKNTYQEVAEKALELEADYLKQRAAFAKTLIAYRNQVADFTLPLAKNSQILPLPDSAYKFKLVNGDRNFVNSAIKDISRTVCALTPTKSQGYKVECAEESWALLFNQDIISVNDSEYLTKNKSVFAVLALSDHFIQEYTAIYYLLSHPKTNNNKNITINAIDTRGNVVLSGSGQYENSEISFQINSVKTNGMFPCMVKGQLNCKIGTISNFQGLFSKEIFRKKAKRKIPQLDRA